MQKAESRSQETACRRQKAGDRKRTAVSGVWAPLLTPYCFLLALAAPTVSASAGQAGGAQAPAVLEGKLISAEGRGPAIKTSKKDYSLVAKTAYLLHTLEDARLQNREVRLEGTWKPDGSFEVAHLFTVRDGKLYKVRYFCEICNIAAQQPGNCVCCQRPTELQEIPVNEVGADMVVVP